MSFEDLIKSRKRPGGRIFPVSGRGQKRSESWVGEIVTPDDVHDLITPPKLPKLF
jgi:hypothetical protein